MVLAKPVMARWVPTLLAGSINGVIEAFYGLTLGAIVFSGPLNDHLSIGLGLGLFTTIAIATVTALSSSLSGIIGGVQNVPAILLSLVLATILADLPEADLLPTAIAAIAVTTLTMGLGSLLLGLLRLGNVIRYVPFPVIGGFLGGTGWFIVLGSLLLLTGLPEISTPGVLLRPLALGQLLPGFAFAVTHILLLPRYPTPLLLPGIILGSLPLFYLALALTGTSLTQAGDLGLLLGPFAGDGRWQPWQLAALPQARWDLVLGQGQNIGVLLAVTLLAVLLNLCSLEVVLQDEMDLNRELRTVGLANLVSGLGGGLVGFHGLRSSVLGYGAIGARSRWVGLIVALWAAGALALGPGVVSGFPRYVLGGLGLSLGYSFLQKWLWLSRHRLTQMDYAIVVVIALTMATLGVLPGVGLGLMIAIATFLINYSRIDVVRHRLSGRNQSSSIDRPTQQQQTLQAMGDQIQVLKLQGYLFFGSTHQILTQVNQLAITFDPNLPQFILLDFKQVAKMDSSVAYGFMRLKQAAQPPLRLVLTHLKPEFQHLLSNQGCLAPQDPVYHLEPDLDRGLQWCETQLLNTLSWRRRRFLPMPLQLSQRLPDPDQATILMDFLEKELFDVHSLVFEVGQAADRLYFLEVGQISTFSTSPTGEWIPDRTSQAGTIIGGAAFFSTTDHRVRALAAQPSVVYGLGRDGWQTLIAEHPKTAALFQQMMMEQIAYQVLRVDTELKALLA
jgi:sulfate permease, SulP family